MYRHLKKYMIFIVGAFVCSLFLVLAFTTDRKNDNSVNAVIGVTMSGQLNLVEFSYKFNN